jgi:4-hydroxy-3-methylbut-2-en-1-yl diphosphate synthase IspG/GcpE
MKPEIPLVRISEKGAAAGNGAAGSAPAFVAHTSSIPRRKTYGVRVGKIIVGGGAPVVVQSMTNTDTANADSTFQQCLELAQAGSELLRITVNVPEAAAAVPEIKQRLLDAGCTAPIIGRFPLQRTCAAEAVSEVRGRAG